MRIFIITLGTRGDVQPYVALGKGLQAAGHAVTICASHSFEPLIARHGLSYGYMNDDILDLIHSDEGRRIIDNTSGLWEWMKLARRMATRAGPMHRRALQDGWESARKADPDLIIYHPKAFGAPHYAEALGIPAVMATVMPLLVRTAEFPMIGFPRWRLGPAYNRLTYLLGRKFMAGTFTRFADEWRATHGLPPQLRRHDLLRTTAGRPIPVLHGYSRHILPRPADWPPEAVVTGHWYLDETEGWQPPDALQAFLDAGEPPLYVGFGSMLTVDPQRLTRMVIEAVRIAGVRAIIATGWGALAADDLPASTLAIAEAPHDWLFQRVRAVVHHGGAGTAAAGLRAGRPTVICPFIGDQPFWGQRVHALGVGSEPIPHKKLTAEKLAGAIRAVMSDQTMRRKAESLGERIREEDGIGNAILALRPMLSQARRSPAPGRAAHCG